MSSRYRPRNTHLTDCGGGYDPCVPGCPVTYPNTQEDAVARPWWFPADMWLRAFDAGWRARDRDGS